MVVFLTYPESRTSLMCYGGSHCQLTTVDDSVFTGCLKYAVDVVPDEPQQELRSQSAASRSRDKKLCPLCRTAVVCLPRHLQSKVHMWDAKKARNAVQKLNLRKKYTYKSIATAMKNRRGRVGKKLLKDYHITYSCPFPGCEMVVKRLRPHLKSVHKLELSSLIFYLKEARMHSTVINKSVVNRSMHTTDEIRMETSYKTHLCPVPQCESVVKRLPWQLKLEHKFASDVAYCVNKAIDETDQPVCRMQANMGNESNSHNELPMVHDANINDHAVVDCMAHKPQQELGRQQCSVGTSQSHVRDKKVCPACQTVVVDLPRHLKSKKHQWDAKMARSAVQKLNLRKKYTYKNNVTALTNRLRAFGGHGRVLEIPNTVHRDRHKSHLCPIPDCESIVKRLSQHLKYVHKFVPRDVPFYRNKATKMHFAVNNNQLVNEADQIVAESQFYRNSNRLRGGSIDVNNTDTNSEHKHGSNIPSPTPSVVTSRSKLFTKAEISVIIKLCDLMVHGGSITKSRVFEALGRNEEGTRLLTKYTFSQLRSRITYERQKLKIAS